MAESRKERGDTFTFQVRGAKEHVSRLEKGRGVDRETELELTGTDKEPDRRVDTPSGRCTTNQALGGWGSDKGVHSSDQSLTWKEEEGANTGGDHSFIKRGVKVDREVSTVVRKQEEEKKILIEEEIEQEMLEVIKQSRLERKREREKEWWENHEKKKQVELDNEIKKQRKISLEVSCKHIREIIVRIISTTVDNSESKQKVKDGRSETGELVGASCPQGGAYPTTFGKRGHKGGGGSLDTFPPVQPSTGLGEPLQNSSVKKRKQKVSPGILKIKKIFEKEEETKKKSETEKYSRVEEIKGAFEVMMEKSKTMYRIEEIREKKKIERKNKRDEKVRMYRVESRVQTGIERFGIQNDEETKLIVEDRMKIKNGVKRKMRERQKSESRLTERSVEKKRRVEIEANEKMGETNPDKRGKIRKSEEATQNVKRGPKSVNQKIQLYETNVSDKNNCVLKPVEVLPWYNEDRKNLNLKSKIPSKQKENLKGVEDLLQKHGNKNEIKSENVIEQNKMVGEKVKGGRGFESEDQKKEKKNKCLF